MAAMVMEGALDLSAKPTSEGKSTSPVPSITSDTDSQQGDQPGERSESVSSDGHDTDTSTSTAVKAITAPIPGLSFPKPGSPKVGSPEQASPDAQTSPGGVRPFKMYPFEPLPGIYSQMAAVAATAVSSQSALYPGPLTNTSFPMGMMDPMATVSLSSPIMSYLQSRKRRMESKSSLSPSMLDGEFSPTDKKLKTPSEGNESDSSKDEHYWERRRKNNEAAKRSRDARRAKEEEIALRAAFLEQENLKLRAQVAILKNETAKLHYMLYNRM